MEMHEPLYTQSLCDKYNNMTAITQNLGLILHFLFGTNNQ
jgi:hypothetical protein